MSGPSLNDKAILDLILLAGREIMAIYAGDFAAHTKDDLSPVTEADERAEHIILEGLTQHTPAIPVISEEAAAAGRAPAIGTHFYLVDPLDGTKEFISRNGEFTINIALIEDKRPIMGVIYAPVPGRLFWGRRGLGAYEARTRDNLILDWHPIEARKPPEGLTVVTSRSHKDAATEAYIKNLPVRNLITAGSSLKFCLVAAGEADLYPRFGRTMEWDTAAGHAILEAAGGHVTHHDGSEFLYGKCAQSFDNPGFLAKGR